MDRGLNAVDAHWDQLWNGAMNETNPQTVFTMMKNLEQKLIEDEMIFQDASIPANISESTRNKMISIKQGFANWARIRRQAAEKIRHAVMNGSLNQSVGAEVNQLLDSADANMVRSNIELADLENKVGK